MLQTVFAVVRWVEHKSFGAITVTDGFKGHNEWVTDPTSRLRVLVLGSTGSIGTQALEVIAANPDRFEVVGLAAGGASVDTLRRQRAETGVTNVAVTDERAAEQEALARGCRGVYLDTFSFQAPGFYRKQGYTEFGELEGIPPGHSHYFFRKLLRTDGPVEGG